MPKKRHIETIARAVMTHADHVLLCYDRSHDFYALPGGHVEFDEPAADACARELAEESDIDGATVGACLVVHEHLFDQRGKARHEINILFHVEHPHLRDAPNSDNEPLPAVATREDHIEYRWVAASDLAVLDVKPVSTRDWLIRYLREGGSDGLCWLTGRE